MWFFLRNTDFFYDLFSKKLIFFSAAEFVDYGFSCEIIHGILSLSIVANQCQTIAIHAEVDITDTIPHIIDT